MKKSLLLVYSCLIFTTAFAQKEFWGQLSSGGTAANYGGIFKTDFNGTNAAIVHLFNATNGMQPYGKLFQASNGKLYGTASKGGYTIPGTTVSGGVLFEYDLVLDSFRVVTTFGDGPLSNLNNPKTGVIEPLPGILVGTASGVGTFKYNLATGVTTVGSLVFASYPGSGAFPNTITGELMKAANGNVYGTSQYYSSCPTAMPFAGSIIRFNPVTNSFTYIYPFNCTYYDGVGPAGSLVEGAPGKLYGTTWRGGDFGYANSGIGDGTLFEYTIATNTFTKKINFNGQTFGFYPGPLIAGGNNKLYGVLGSGGKDPADPDTTNKVQGSLYEYDIPTNTVTVLHYFSDQSPNIFPFATPRGSLLKASDGNLFGIDNGTIFKFDPVTKTISRPATPTLSFFHPNDMTDLIEICRKPNYRYFATNSFTVCAGTSFSFDTHNSNATTYAWKQNGITVPGQTSGVLNISSVMPANSGTYTCEMLNACGTTVTMPFTLLVNTCTTGQEEAIALKNAVTLFPNPATDVLQLKITNRQDFKIEKVTISNLVGQPVYSNSTFTEMMNTSSFTPGIYVVEMKTDKGSWVGKFVKQ